MNELKAPHRHFVRAAEGWLELGNPLEARRELDQLAAPIHKHPEVLEMRWRIQAATREWDACLDTATTIRRLAPDRPSGWSLGAYALHQLKRTAEARQHLLAVVDRFPNDLLMHYNLACYECLLGRLPEAWRWLQLALRVGPNLHLTLAALGDPELQPLWLEIEAHRALDLSQTTSAILPCPLQPHQTI